MADIKKKLDISVDIDKPVDEIKECIIGISIFHGPNQLGILKEIEIWLGKTIEDAESRMKAADKPEVMPGDPVGNS